MAVKINGKGRDDRVERILKDPQAYFSRARRAAEAEVREDMAREAERLHRGPAPA